MSLRLALATLFLVSTASARDTGRRPRADFKYDYWESWNSFREGCSVTVEVGSGGTHYKMTMTLLSKQSDRLTMQSLMEFNGQVMPASTYEIRKQTGGATPDAKCGACFKPLKDHAKPEQKQSREKIKIGDRALDCVRVDRVGVVYTTAEKWTYTAWYSRDVPGWLAKWESRYGASASTQVCLSFEKK